ncbi:hypothetical protein L7H23_05100 [Sphingopyxis sp. BSN-002]|uniref:hypothetical protein n=1 Tax=Sphingopyxis sp. BSN-002 TaxID=2911495 RepID=UPI001EDA086F|nr:hypothetical protein [Sphingopyxis sp. BSN-002]UKK85487.1 hypothetical protein L7H23_05100 [Sphingopyxis sp. BSN-002]
MARLFACLLILLLGGCGMAVSEKPMFAEADAAGAPTPADGIWLIRDKADCRFDEAEPMARWPACASWAEYRDGRWFEPVGGRGPTMKPLESDILLVGGKVALMQIRYAEGIDGTGKDPVYFFMAFDNPAGDRKLKSIALWPVMCGTKIDYKTAAEERSPEPVVKKRYPGFDEKCRPASQKALRSAASASRPEPSKLLRLEWMRERQG